MKYVLARQSAPAADILTTAEAKTHLRVDHTGDDDYISALIAVVTARLDGHSGVLGRALISQTWRIYLHAAPVGPIKLPLPPVQYVTSIGYYDPDGAEQTFGASNYRLFTSGDDAWVELVSGSAWPVLQVRSGALWVDYVAGYGNSKTSVPGPIKQAALLMLGHLYENREAVADVRGYELPLTETALLAPFRAAPAIL